MVFGRSMRDTGAVGVCIEAAGTTLAARFSRAALCKNQPVQVSGVPNNKRGDGFNEKKLKPQATQRSDAEKQ
jgi:hypothetical protein